MIKPGDRKFNYAVPIALLLIIVVIGVALLAGGSDKPKTAPAKSSSKVVYTSCGPYRKDGIVTINNNQINVETVASQKDLTRGLSGRPCIEGNWGMLFDFGRDGQYAIWMKDMKFPIDVAWISSAHKVVALEIDFKPSTYPERRVNQAPARYVLEFGANQSKKIGTDLGTPVHFQKY